MFESAIRSSEARAALYIFLRQPWSVRSWWAWCRTSSG